MESLAPESPEQEYGRRDSASGHVLGSTPSPGMLAAGVALAGLVAPLPVQVLSNPYAHYPAPSLFVAQGHTEVVKFGWVAWSTLLSAAAFLVLIGFLLLRSERRPADRSTD